MSISYINTYLLGSVAAFPTPAFSWESEIAQTPPGSVSFTRATTATVLGTTDGTTNWYQTAKSGEIRYEGLRRVENNFTLDGLAPFSVFGGSSKLGDELTFPGLSSGEIAFQTVTGLNSGLSIGLRLRLRVTSGTADVDIVLFNSTSSNTQTVSLTATAQDFYVQGSELTNTFNKQVRISNSAAGGPFNTVIVVEESALYVVPFSQSAVQPMVLATTTYNANVAGVQYFATTNGNSVDGNGVVTEAAGTSITGGGYLAEPTSTNQFATVDIADASWAKAGVTVTDNGVNSLGLTEYEIDTGLTNNVHNVREDGAVASAGTSYAILKQGTGNFAIIVRGASSTTDFACFDLNLGVVTQDGTGITSSFIIDLSDGWYLCGVVSPDIAALSRIGVSNTGTPGTGQPIFTGANETILVCHAQYESNDFPTSPIVTSGSTVTRNDDVLAGTAWIAAAPYSVFIDQTAPQVFNTENRILRLDTGVNDLETDGSGNITLTADTGLSLAPSGAITAGDRDKMALRYADNDAALAVTGKTTVTDASVTVNANAEGDLNLGGAGAGGIIHKVQTYSVALTDAELETLVA